MRTKRISLKELRKIVKQMVNEQEEEFVVHGTYNVSNHGGYEVMLSPSGDSAKVREAFGMSDSNISDWLEIEHVPDEDSLDYEAVIDPNGYNIPLSKVMRVNNFWGDVSKVRGDVSKVTGDPSKI